ncbi:thioredoxin domain-containing protein [Aquihabitans sp. G128]|uniref:vitamin K epoxide reductase family protein n=1 Tax=Aquihabitans sp. G128 TaxID=2849779 RepID=UPI001C21D5BB|nr:vitamin K epoxide reductase family protein [Aquihabitans sp. G128]QXC60595.1 thioredoxin domain-containing protein [Aquihabitans sp. G128]
MKKNVLIPLVMVALAAAVALALAFSGDDSSPDAQPAKSRSDRVVRPDSQKLNDVADAKVTFVEFLDFECEACGALYPLVEQLRTTYGDRVTFVVRNFPLHANSESAASAAEAAASQGKFEEMYKKLYETQPEWAEQQASQDDVFFGFAEDLGLDMTEFEKDFEDPATLAKIRRDKADGKALGVEGTPTIFLNGQKLEPESPPGPHRQPRSRTRRMSPAPVAPVHAHPAAFRARSRRLGVLLASCGAIGLTAASTLLVEKIELIRDPGYVPSCSINPILSCGSVMETSQAEAFGFPNPIIGIAGFAMLLTAGVTLLGGFRPPRWFWLSLQAGVTFGVVFVHWLIFQSLYRIGALCPYCMVVWTVTIPSFWYVTLYNLNAGHLPVRRPDRTRRGWLSDNHAIVLTAWALLIVGLIGRRFWEYWSSLVT